MTRIGTLCLLTLLGHCGGEGVSVTDPRFATPERTVETLYAAHGVADLDAASTLARLGRGPIPVVDRPVYEACFADLDGPADPRAVYVTGLLLAARGRLRFEIAGDHARAFPREGVRVAFLRGAEGAFRIHLANSSSP
jgi:hypothetical protein